MENIMSKNGKITHWGHYWHMAAYLPCNSDQNHRAYEDI